MSRRQLAGLKESPRASARASSSANKARCWSSNCSLPKASARAAAGDWRRHGRSSRSAHPRRAGKRLAGGSRPARDAGAIEHPADRAPIGDQRAGGAQGARPTVPTAPGFRARGARRPGSLRSRRRRECPGSGRPRRSAGAGRRARARTRRERRPASRGRHRSAQCGPATAISPGNGREARTAGAPHRRGRGRSAAPSARAGGQGASRPRSRWRRRAGPAPGNACRLLVEGTFERHRSSFLLSAAGDCCPAVGRGCKDEVYAQASAINRRDRRARNCPSGGP